MPKHAPLIPAGAAVLERTGRSAGAVSDALGRPVVRSDGR
jgi:hypothetical protein